MKSIAGLGHCEVANELDPVIDRRPHKLPQEGIEDELESFDDRPKCALEVLLLICLEEVDILSFDFVLYLADEELAPLDDHLLSHSFMEVLLNACHFS